jgi:signal peptidase
MTAIITPGRAVRSHRFAPRHRRHGRRPQGFRQAGDRIVGLAFVGVLAAVTLPRLAGWQSYVVHGTGMGGTAPVGSLVAMKPVAPAAVRAGELLVLRRADGTPVMRRVVQVVIEDGQVTVQTRGDAEPAPDPGFRPVPATAMTPTLIVPRLGYAAPVVTSTAGRCILGTVAALLLIRAWLRSRVPAHRGTHATIPSAGAAGRGPGRRRAARPDRRRTRRNRP